VDLDGVADTEQPARRCQVSWAFASASRGSE
jgi:hypothetical protein